MQKTNKEFFLKKFSAELPIFMRVFKAVEDTPIEKHDHRHDPKGKSAFELVSHTFAFEASTYPGILTNGTVDFSTYSTHSHPELVSTAAKMFEEKMLETQHIIENMTEAQWEEPASMMMGDAVVFTTTKGEMMWNLFFDLVHHRGQLSTFIRPMGGKVPSIYGPTADTVQ